MMPVFVFPFALIICLIGFMISPIKQDITVAEQGILG